MWGCWPRTKTTLFSDEAIASAKPTTFQDELNDYHKKSNAPLFVTLLQQEQEQQEPDATTDEEPPLT